jgi:hypothetical protein
MWCATGRRSNDWWYVGTPPFKTGSVYITNMAYLTGRGQGADLGWDADELELEYKH